ncbi:MAG: type II secretion system protein GspM [Marinicellaceae bacterium]
MDSLKNSEFGRWYALVILLLVFVLVYFLFFHGFVSEHKVMNEELSELEQSRIEYTELQSQIPELQKRINQVKENVGDNTNFLVADTANLGTSELNHILKNIVNANTENRTDCNIVSNTGSADREPDQFEKIIIKVRMRCHFDKMMRILNDLETYVPILFVDKLELEQRTIRRRTSRTAQVEVRPMLEVRFELFAYMNKPVKVREND